LQTELQESLIMIGNRSHVTGYCCGYPYELDLLPSDLRKILGLLDPPTPLGKLTSGTTPRPSTETSARKGDLIGRALSRVSSEGRNNAGFWLACQLRDNGYSQAEAETRMREYADAVPATNMKGQAEPYTHTEALTSLQQAYAAPRREPWPMKPPTEPGPSVHAEPEHKPQPEVARLPSNQPRSRQRFTITPALGLELYQMEHREPPWVVKDLIHTGETLLCGREKTGKSYLALQLALDVVLERRALGKFDLVKPGRALFFALEDVPRRITRRLKQLLPAPTSEEMQLLENLHIQFTLPVLSGDGKAALREHLQHNRYSLVVLDPLVAVLPGNRRHDIFRADYGETRMVREIAQEFETAFLCSVHSRKMPSTDPRDLVAGTTGAGAGADSILVLRRQPDNQGTLHIISREIESTDWALKFDLEHGGWNVTGSAADSAISEERMEILTLLKDEAPLRPARIALMLHKNANTTRRLLQMLYQDGFVRRNSDGSYCLSSTNT
jgi:hypothetical protein